MHDALLAAGAGAPSLDLDITLFIQMGIFFALWFFLSGKLFKPYLQAREERVALTKGAREEAEGFRREAGAILDDLESQLAEARREAQGLKREEVEAGKEQASSILEQARADAEKTKAQAKAELEDELKTARRAMEPQAKDLSDHITQRLLAS